MSGRDICSFEDPGTIVNKIECEPTRIKPLGERPTVMSPVVYRQFRLAFTHGDVGYFLEQ